MNLGLFVAAVLTVALSWGVAAAEKKSEKPKKVESNTFRPDKKEFKVEYLRQLKVPDGFEISVFAEKLGNARMMILGPNGQILLTRYKEGDLLTLHDRNNDGKMDEYKQATGIKNLHGIALHDGTLYLASDTKLFKARLKEDGSIDAPQQFGTLPDGGQHPRRTLRVGPDRLLYVSVGSTCNSCQETNPEHATMLRMGLDGAQRTIFARGLRNTIGFDFHPGTRELWGFDHGSDERGDDLPPEELNLLKQGGDYGWPFCYGKKLIDPHTNPPQNGTKEQHCAKSEGSVLEYQAHSAPIEFIFYNAQQFPAEYRGSAFVAFHGSWNRQPATGYNVSRVRFENGKPAGIEDFVTGFLIENGRAHFGRPAGLVVARDGALLISDDENGTIYRVSARKKEGN